MIQAENDNELKFKSHKDPMSKLFQVPQLRQKEGWNSFKSQGSGAEELEILLSFNFSAKRIGNTFKFYFSKLQPKDDWSLKFVCLPS